MQKLVGHQKDLGFYSQPNGTKAWSEQRSNISQSCFKKITLAAALKRDCSMARIETGNYCNSQIKDDGSSDQFGSRSGQILMYFEDRASRIS